eukprot:gnl/MRDRNA2_/MRDRNA2_77405_c0_seq2.p1 gnl/MRDRNA2_/MRDRNA2_77405_c0~~gnl/MRDRNA2_/MRDRNA2_77405_c0_seq2.p1  ORF type:complete len:746 (+),score=109.26 gnl/MRDRNA2_/MRDRNA2_77405_c0_seq2:159-2396(+)
MADAAPCLSARTLRHVRHRFIGFLLLFCVIAAWLLYEETAKAVWRPAVVAEPSDRHLAAQMVNKREIQKGGCQGETAESGPIECIKDDKQWTLVFYFCGILYMFLALAIVCDEFFVPALELFVDVFDISMDVAGATFMAAGGSAPELCTSFIGTFSVPMSDVGFGTIVGSAVFNVLFVIGVCAVSSKDVLTLTWWPLFRDCSYYCMSLLTLAMFFRDYTIETWEAAILLTMYIGYVFFMKHNQHIYTLISEKFGLKDAVEVFKETDEDGEVSNYFLKPSSFRTGIVQLLCQKEDIVDTAGVLAVSKVRGNMRETFDKFDKDNSGHIDAGELEELLQFLGCKTTRENLEMAMKTINTSVTGLITFDEFSRWYIGSEARIEIKMRRVFDKFDTNGNGKIDRHEVTALLSSLGHHVRGDALDAMIEEIKCAHPETRLRKQTAKSEASVDSEVKKRSSPSSETGDAAFSNTIGTSACPPDSDCPERAMTPIVVPNDMKSRESLDEEISLEEFAAWYHASLFWEQKRHQFEMEQKVCEGGFNIEPPEDGSPRQMFWYYLTYPICVALYATLPDVRRHNRGSLPWAIAEFVGSIAWIAFFSFCMVDWATLASNTLGIPVPVAGLTVIAAGTSVPDLLSSYIVARQGEGDMAVSSSIGSNIFDVLVGLPLPWLCYGLFNDGASVRVTAKSLGFSIFVLLFMLLVVILSIKISKWRMTRSMGYGMFVLYFVFVGQDLLQQFPVGNPIVSTPKF